MQNPAHNPETSTSPVDRSNPLNDPQYYNKEGYNNYDLTYPSAITPRFGEITPCFAAESVPGDRHLLMDTSLHILNQIDSNLFSQVNSYTNFVYTPLRCIYPVNFEKLIANPTKGTDLPAAALPQIPLFDLLKRFIYGPKLVSFYNFYTSEEGELSLSDGFGVSLEQDLLLLNNLIYVSYVLSRGSLLDYLDFSIDTKPTVGDDASFIYKKYVNKTQQLIDNFFDSLVSFEGVSEEDDHFSYRVLSALDLSSFRGLSSRPVPDAEVYFTPFAGQANIFYRASEDNFDRSGFRCALYDAIEKGLFIQVYSDSEEGDELLHINTQAARALLTHLRSVLSVSKSYDLESSEFTSACINPSRIVAYQQTVAEYYTNDQIDNVYTAELWMQNVRAIMFPADETGITKEPTFDYNGVATEYDLFTIGATRAAFMTDAIRYYVERFTQWLSVVFGMRRSLRYGDMFSTGRPNLLAVGGQMSIPVSGNTVDPIAVNNGLLIARYKNASNWIGSKYSNYAPSIFGVQPSDQGCRPYWIAQRMITLERDIVTNTAQDQGRQSTNLKGTSDNQGFDAFTDDFGVLLGLVSYDVLPLYPSGRDANYSLSDRFSYFNPMLQNVGDQAIKLSELSGIIDELDPAFAYIVRYGNYKMRVGRAHGAFVNSLPGYAMLYPWTSLSDYSSDGVDLRINPDFIRDKPFYFDQFFKSRTGMSPGNYYHFEVVVTNIHTAARKMQYTPLVL